MGAFPFMERLHYSAAEPVFRLSFVHWVDALGMARTRQ
jgi:hypothetical protein